MKQYYEENDPKWMDPDYGRKYIGECCECGTAIFKDDLYYNIDGKLYCRGCAEEFAEESEDYANWATENNIVGQFLDAAGRWTRESEENPCQ